MESDGEHCREWTLYTYAKKDFTNKVQAGYSTRLCRFLPGTDSYWNGEETTLEETL
jgi:hypothetical protein